MTRTSKSAVGVIAMSEGKRDSCVPDHQPTNETNRVNHLTTPTDIDRSAPVIANHEIDIAASLDEVWQLHVNINAWPTWHHEVSIADLDGAFAPGHSFTWTSYAFTVTSTIYDVTDHSRTLWGGEAQGIMGTHEWSFEKTDGGVHVATTESFAGAPVVADAATFQGILDSSLTTWLNRLKEKAESALGEG
jgi:Polyketide cyclase / dehydrase and lipid transport